MVQDDEPVGLDGVRVEFDDERVVSDAGVMLVATLAAAAGDRGARRAAGAAAARPAGRGERGAQGDGAAVRDGAGRRQHRRLRRAARRAHAAAAGRLAAGAVDAGDVSARVHVRARAPARRAARPSRLSGRGRPGAGPGRRAAGDRCRQLRRRGLRLPEAGRRLRLHAGCSGYHPILATRADTREALHIRLRKGSANTQKGIKRFCEELIARVERAGATGIKLLRADSGFWNTKVFELLETGRLAVLDRRAQHQDGPRGGRGDRRGRLADASTTPTAARRRSPRPSTAAAG